MRYVYVSTSIIYVNMLKSLCDESDWEELKDEWYDADESVDRLHDFILNMDQQRFNDFASMNESEVSPLAFYATLSTNYQLIKQLFDHWVEREVASEISFKKKLPDTAIYATLKLGFPKEKYFRLVRVKNSRNEGAHNPKALLAEPKDYWIKQAANSISLLDSLRNHIKGT